jgi:hypothetical protein
MAIARVIEAERHCTIVLEVSGPPGTGAFLEQLLAPA